MSTSRFHRGPFHSRLGRKLRGFALVELVLVCCILAVIAGMAVPRFASALTRNRVEAAARRVVNDLTLAQRHARLSSASQHVLFENKNSYRLAGMADPDHPASEYTVWLGEPPYEVAILNVNMNNGTELVFGPYGVPNTGGSLVVQAGDVARLITIAADTGQATITETSPVAAAN
jgi:Tfp pilus assembly protein FimT